jgi:23S rRNA pseudouridine1911/1915/1917 synthase
METDRPKQYAWTIDAGTVKQRLDQFLAARFSDESRSQVQRWIARGVFVVNGKIVAKDYPLKVGDLVERNAAVNAEQEEKVRAAQTPVEIPVLFEDESILVINKPIGVLVHPAPQSDEWTLVDFVRAHCAGIDGVGEDPTRPGIVHRLDRDVSGVMVIAKTVSAWEHLKEQFMQRSITKEYRAIVFGAMSKPTGTITFKIAHSTTRGGKMAAKPDHEVGREAWTEYEVLQAFRR